jgi:HNH endonuclease
MVPQVKGGVDDPQNLIELCRDCHEQLHVLYNPNHLRDHLHTGEQILADENMRKFARFASKQVKRVRKKESKTKWRC